jgi:hypothetical protein
MSYKRPVCNIFVAGITQFPTMVYCLLALGMRRWPSLSSIVDVDPLIVVAAVVADRIGEIAISDHDVMIFQ